MAKNRDKIVGDLDIALTNWTNLSRETENKLNNLQQYYSGANERNQEEVITTAHGIHTDEMKTCLTRHRDLCGEAKTAADSLTSQVRSSESGSAKMKKYGFIAAAGFSLMGIIIAAAFATRYTGFTQPITILVAVVIALAFTAFAFTIYLVMRIRRARKASTWQTIERKNENGLGLYRTIEPKRTCIGEIRNNLDDLEMGNYTSGIQALQDSIEEAQNM